MNSLKTDFKWKTARVLKKMESYFMVLYMFSPNSSVLKTGIFQTTYSVCVFVDLGQFGVVSVF